MSGGRNSSQDPNYVGPVGHEKKFHKTHFGAVKEFSGNRRVKVKTKDGFTYMSETAAIEGGFEIVKEKRQQTAQGAEVE